VKRGTGRKMIKTRAPKVFWDFCAKHVTRIRANTARNLFVLENEVPETLMTGQTSDISPLVEFGWYDWCYFYNTSQTFPDDKEILGRYLGEAHAIGSAMAARILKHNGEVVVCSTLRPLISEEMHNEVAKKKRYDFDTAICVKLGNPSTADDFEYVIDIETPTIDH
jgi:hypothetical protein